MVTRHKQPCCNTWAQQQNGSTDTETNDDYPGDDDDHDDNLKLTPMKSKLQRQKQVASELPQ